MCAFAHPISQYSIRQLLPSASFVGCGDISFRDVVSDSRKARPGDLFVAMSGVNHHGNYFAAQAIGSGANGVLTETPIPELLGPQCIVSDVRRSFGWLCQYLKGRPTDQFQSIGVTGTNGKTTISWLLREILNGVGHRAGLIGTIECDDTASPPVPSKMTTPDPKSLANWFSRMDRAGASHAVFEVSSHALDQKRIAGVSLQTAVITNIARDHLDYHETVEDYRNAKCSIANFCSPSGQLLINGDDPCIQAGLEKVGTSMVPVTIGFDRCCQHQIQVINQSRSSSHFSITWEGTPIEMTIRIPGRFNIFNSAVAAVAALYECCDPAAVAQQLSQAHYPAGRLQSMESGNGIWGCVDYAHTPDAIENVLETLRPHVKGRLICVFGAGGERDKEKRPLMAQASMAADQIILTSDNPRHEPLQEIFEGLLEGFPAGRTADLVEPDRAAAIRWAVTQANPGDCVLVLGKGHETVQCIGDEVKKFDDFSVLRELLTPNNQPVSHLRAA